MASHAEVLAQIAERWASPCDECGALPDERCVDLVGKFGRKVGDPIIGMHHSRGRAAGAATIGGRPSRPT